MVEVGVSIVTYNHEQYICKCIDSFLEQETNFEFEITIYDDCSTDNTIQILKERYGNLLKYHINQTNKGIGENFFDALSCGEYKYRVLYAGDDWLIGNQSLQKMYDLISFRPNCSAIGVWSRVFNKDGEFLMDAPTDCKCFTMRPFLCGKSADVDIVMFRNIYDREKDKWVYELNRESNEPQLFFSTLLKGDICVLPEYIRGYRFVNDTVSDNYNSTHNALDTYFMFRQVLTNIEQKIDMEGLFYYKMLDFTSTIIKNSIVQFIKRKNANDLKKVLNNISLKEFTHGFINMIFVELFKDKYKDRVLSLRIKKHKNKYNLSQIGERIC